MRVFVILLSLSVTVGVNAQSVTRCKVAANLLDQDPKGANVRSGPGKSFSIIGNLPLDKTDTVKIVASSDGWVKIQTADDEDGNVFFRTEGWAFASLFGLSTANNRSDKNGY